MNNDDMNRPVTTNGSPFTQASGQDMPRTDDGSDKFRIPEPYRAPHGTSGNTGVYRGDSDAPAQRGVFRNNTPPAQPANGNGSGKRYK